MERDPHQSLTVEEAKARLRTAAQNATLGSMISKRTWPLLLLAVAGGFVAARLSLPTLVGSVVVRRAAPLLLGALLGSRHAPHESRHPKSSASSSLKSR